MAEQDTISPSVTERAEFVVIGGFGLPGRSLADSLRDRGIEYRVIEKNADTVARRARGGTPILSGDASDEAVLRAAGIERATLFAAMMPDDDAVLRAVEIARRLNPAVRIIARCAYTSSGIEATRRGADDVVISEQAVARELLRVIGKIGPL